MLRWIIDKAPIGIRPSLDMSGQDRDQVGVCKGANNSLVARLSKSSEIEALMSC